MKGRKRHLNVVKPEVKFPDSTAIDERMTTSYESAASAVDVDTEVPLTIIDALDTIQQRANKSKLCVEFWESCDNEISYLCEVLDLNRNQVVLVAILSEVGEALSWRHLGDFLGLSRLKAMAFTSDIEDLKRKRWVYQCAAHERSGMFDGIKLTRGVINAFRHNEKFEPEVIEGLSEQAFVDRLTRYINNEGDDNSIPLEENHRWMMQLVESNLHLPICNKVMDLREDISKYILLLIISDFARYGGTDDEGVALGLLNNWFDGEYMFDFTADELQSGTQELFAEGIVEFRCNDGMAENEVYVLTSNARNEFVSNYTPHRKPQPRRKTDDRDLLYCGSITPKTLFYNNQEAKQLTRMKQLFGKEELQSVQERLINLGLRKGISCLFYGAPGTGKTETVLQLARETGRDVMQVDIASIRDKFVGETEKNIKQIFQRYRELCKGCEVTPILLFNEADALINSRFESTRSSVEKMDNAMQNIILQEMENLEGILIATTNLTGVLDPAFDRRFLFKIEFHKPELEVRKALWESMNKELNGDSSLMLAKEFNFTGGQIENVVRKTKIEFVMTGEYPSYERIREFCQEESLNRNTRNTIGFAS